MADTIEQIVPADPLRVFFQEAKPGDVRKHQAQSNDADTGGGARDLRMPKKFWGPISVFFPDVTSTRQRSGKILSRTDSTVLQHTINLWQPTKARPGEVRIGEIYLIERWQLTLADLKAEAKDGYLCMYLLILDKNQRVWARTMTTRHLDRNVKEFADYLRRMIADKPNEKQTARGIFSFETGGHFPP